MQAATKRTKRALPPLDIAGRRRVYEVIEEAGPVGISSSRLRAEFGDRSSGSLAGRLAELVDAGLIEPAAIPRGKKSARPLAGYRATAEGGGP